MAKLAPITEQFQHFVQELKESFWGDLQARAMEGLKKFLEGESLREREQYLGAGWYERTEQPRRDYRNGVYERDNVTPFGTLRLRSARARGRSGARASRPGPRRAGRSARRALPARAPRRAAPRPERPCG